MPRFPHILLLMLLTLSPLAAAAQDEITQDSTFLTLVIDAVKPGDQLVIERNGAVLDEQSPKSGALLTTRTFVSTNLTGHESYVWTVLQGVDGWHIGSRNGFYINNLSSTNLSLDFEALSTSWVFVFAEDSTATIYTADLKRFIGETDAYSGQYKCFGKASLSSCGHDFHIYRLDRPQPASTTLTNANANANAVKTLENGMVIIEKAGVKYTILGQPVR